MVTCSAQNAGNRISGLQISKIRPCQSCSTRIHAALAAGCANFSSARNIIRAKSFVVAIVKIKRAFKIPTRTKTFIVWFSFA